MIIMVLVASRTCAECLERYSSGSDRVTCSNCSNKIGAGSSISMICEGAGMN